MRTSAPKGPQEIRIADHFNGPPGMGQGGYSAGLLAQQFQGLVRVTLRKPIPLESTLRITHSQDGKAVLLDGEVVIADAEPATLNFEALPAPNWEDAVRAAAGYPGFTQHPYPTCFGCGHLRNEGDGLRIFSAPSRRPWGKGSPGPLPGCRIPHWGIRMAPSLQKSSGRPLTVPVAGPAFPSGAVRCLKTHGWLQGNFPWRSWHRCIQTGVIPRKAG